MSESLEVAIFLALSGGLMDVYSYLIRGHVFANAQTGNILLFGIYAANGQWDEASAYILSIVSFMLGIAICEIIHILSNERHLHWRQYVLLVEIFLLIIVAFIPTTHNNIANALTSGACGLQVQAFRKLHGKGFATTMCIGNLRSGTQAIIHYFHTKNKRLLLSASLYYLIILCFMMGAIIGSKALVLFKTQTIFISCWFLLIAWTIMFIDREKNA